MLGAGRRGCLSGRVGGGLIKATGRRLAKPRRAPSGCRIAGG